MKAFKICYVSSEVAPFVKTTQAEGLAHTSRALPMALKELDQDVRLMMPKYKSINERKYVLREVIRLREVNIELNDTIKSANGKTAFLPNSKVHVYFLSVPEYFDRKGFYSDPQTGKEHSDNAERFGYFCKAVLETLKLLYWQPDIIHCSDWATALIPYYLKTHYQDDDFFQDTRTVLTVHNFALQGRFPLEKGSQIGIAEEHRQAGSAFEQEGQLNLLKGGLSFADVINTISEHAAEELLADPSAAFGLTKALEERRKDFYGILGGTDYAVWDPENDKHIAAAYDAKSLDKKEENKAELCRELDLNADTSPPLLILLPDFSDEKALQPVLEVLKELLKKDLQVVVMNRGEYRDNSALEALAEKNAKKFALRDRFDNRLAHLMMAGADMILLPNEPLNGTLYHLSGLRYGTVPVVHEIGTLADSINTFDTGTGKGNGFSFSDNKKSTVLETVQTALDLYRDKKLWGKLQKNGMRGDFSWENSAKKYLKLYEKAQKK